MIRIVTSAAADQAFVDAVLAAVPGGARVEMVTSEEWPAQAASIDATSGSGERRRIVAVGDARRLNVVHLLDAAHARRVVQVPAGAACLSRLLAEAF